MKKTFEELFRDLEAHLETLSKESTDLNESITTFEKANQLIKECSEILDNSEKRIEKILTTSEKKT